MFCLRLPGRSADCRNTWQVTSLIAMPHVRAPRTGYEVGRLCAMPHVRACGIPRAQGSGSGPRRPSLDGPRRAKASGGFPKVGRAWDGSMSGSGPGPDTPRPCQRHKAARLQSRREHEHIQDDTMCGRSRLPCCRRASTVILTWSDSDSFASPKETVMRHQC